MNRTLLATATVALSLSATPVFAPVAASSALRRCQTADGASIYTDKACAAFDAKSVAISSDLRFRIASEASRENAAASMTGSADAELPAVAAPATRRPLAAGCARTPAQLTMDLRAAVTLGDVNRVAESYHWAGMSSRQGRRTLDRLQRLIGEPTVEANYYNAQIAFASPSPDEDEAWAPVSSPGSMGGNAGVLQLVLGQGTAASFIDFDVERYAGCFFVKF